MMPALTNVWPLTGARLSSLAVMVALPVMSRYTNLNWSAGGGAAHVRAAAHDGVGRRR